MDVPGRVKPRAGNLLAPSLIVRPLGVVRPVLVGVSNVSPPGFSIPTVLIALIVFHQYVQISLVLAA